MRLKLSLILLICFLLAAQTGQRLSSPVIFNKMTTGTPRAAEVEWQNSDGTFFGFRGNLTGTSAMVALPNIGPSVGTCLGYTGVLQTGWVACAGGTSYDPTLGILMVNSTNTGVTGTGDGGHYFWDTTTHTLNIQSWFSGSIAPIIINASHVDATLFKGNIQVTTTPILCPSGFYSRGVNNTVDSVCATLLDPTNGIFTSNNTTPNATSTADGAHWYWEPISHFLSIQSWFSGSVAPISLTASHVDATLFKGNIQVTTTPALCPAGFYSRGVNTVIDSVCATILDPTNGIFTTNNTTPNATTFADGGHWYWDPVGHTLNIQSWFSGSTAPILFAASSIGLGFSPTLCAVGTYARGVSNGLAGTGCTTPPTAGADPTLGLIVVNDTNTNTTNTSVGVHLFYDPGVTTGRIRVYNASNTLMPFVFDDQFTQFNSEIDVQSVIPTFDNTYNLGSTSSRYRDIRTVIAHIGDVAPNVPSNAVFQAALAGGQALGFISAFGNNVAAYLTETSGGTISSPSALANGTAQAVFGTRGYDGSWITSTSASMAIITTQAWNGLAHGNKITINTTAVGSTTNTQRVQVDENGLTVAAMALGSTRAVCVTSVGLIYAAAGTTCP